MTWEIWIAIVDTAILILLAAWSWMDRNNIYLQKKQ